MEMQMLAFFFLAAIWRGGNQRKQYLQLIFVGAPDVILPYISNEVEKKWLQNIMSENAKLGKRVLSVARSLHARRGLPKDLGNSHFSDHRDICF